MSPVDKKRTRLSVSVFSYLPVDVLFQTDGAVGRGAAAQGVGGSAAALTLALPFGLELPRLHLFQGLARHSVHGALWVEEEGGTGQS